MKKEKKTPITFLLEEILKIFGKNLISIVLFGSRARKNYNENSDIDLIIVVEKPENYDVSELRKNFLVKFEKKADLHIFSKKEVMQNFNDCSPLFTTLLLGSKVLFDKNMFFLNCLKNFIKKMIKINIIYCEGDKIWEMQKVARNLEVSQ